ncbi:acyl-CoA dehydrogenase family protein [Mycobacterium aquaticum]|uniref:Acyl-CoA dehydrogenase n=1 Tax=Mycobacterium aquaticum TaxID=1927124 RepID=A0A1X0BAJ8_9MYCO|nr:acyl-CoA dehydrogenase family protein [Mycobacterium aquaticum]ORA39357.1 acyl-CoA dehydrogenase [Mycobacterium aquaticum]
MTATVGVGIPLSRICDSVSERAAALDEHRTDVQADLAQIGAAGLFDLGLGTGGLPDMVTVIDEIAAHSLAVGFSAWAHRMTLEYLRRGSHALQHNVFGQLLSGRRPGVTAMAAGLRYVAGLDDLPVKARRDADGLRLTGPIRWASNVFDDALIVLPAAGDAGETYVVAVDVAQPGVAVNPEPNLMALGATGSTSLRLTDVTVSPDRILSTDLPGFVAAVRPSFLVLQTAFCVGVTRAAVSAAEQVTGGLADEFSEQLTSIAGRSRALRDDLYARASDPYAAPVPDLIRLRLLTAQLALEATRLECTLTGGAAYALGSPANRRFREAAFLPVQSPSEGQLRWELKQYG